MFGNVNEVPRTHIKIKRIGDYSFDLKLYSNKEIVNQQFSLDEVAMVLDGIKRFTNLNGNLLLDYLKKIYSKELLEGFLNRPLNAWQIN